MKIYKESLDTMLGIVRNYTQQTTDMEIERRVYDIIADVRTNGDSALKAYSEKFDGVSNLARCRASYLMILYKLSLNVLLPICYSHY